ncbi:DUF262 domain-containing protein [Stenotrophomonas geniculata]|uniref:DUF262 domain-containing protein n=1 Tax=Stenotrophomonas geniculata TaxID=86188 RepID=UPI0013134287
MSSNDNENSLAQDTEESMPVDDVESSDGAAFVTYEIAAYPADYTLSVLEAMWGEKEIVVPPFQRKFVWSVEQASLLIESLLMGLPVPQAFFFVEAGTNKNLVIDGLQRIMSIVYFFSGYFGEESYQGKKTVFRLVGLSDRSPYADLTYDELKDSDKRKLRNSVLRVINVRQLGPRDDDTSAYHIFERLNTGGTPLTAQEIRHCVFHGPLVELISRLNQDVNWRKILGKTTFDKHQKDTELLLRVLAFATRADLYEKPMKEFLNATMSHYRSADEPEIVRFAANFPVVCEEIVRQVGAKPFSPRGRVNASALDSIMGSLMKNGSVPADFKARHSSLFSDSEFENTLSVSTSDVSIVRQRLAAVAAHLA